MKQVVFPEFLGESEIAVVVIIPSLKEDMTDLFERFHAGEEVDYWFSWDLVVTNTAEYLVVLEINWDQGEGLIVAFSSEMWEFINLIGEKGNMVILGETGELEEGATLLYDEGEYKPFALLIRDVDNGLAKLYDHVKELAAVNENIEELAKLQLILQGSKTQVTTYH
ncbi:hypothetical protein [Desulforamulus reducens]|uniref:hypothetical protein n=1 Tax=Desulforamulus reducens TaxID=59610 RepID=UPI0002E108AE|nr:hypothetical protein [Desulforamulus reducens]